ncbi:unnamed protein product [Gordionus sp. m RMFG-2023]|uniref:N-acetylglutamate synthase, mitochondrial-like n=1 Tax=Gordionus sp. m RMFG-2023 TaxID=3053472 RepID=UPI0030E5A93C
MPNSTKIILLSLHSHLLSSVKSNQKIRKTLGRCLSLSNGENISDLKRFLLEFDADAKEGRYWLKYFKNFSHTQRPFAIAHLDDDVFERKDMLENLSSSLCFLQRNGMKCIIVHGKSFPCNKPISFQEFNINRERQIKNSLELATSFENNRTYSKILFSGSGVLRSNTPRLSQPLQSSRTSSKDTIKSRFSKNGEDYRGELTDINYQIIEWALKSDSIPILGTLAETPSGKLVLTQSDTVLDRMSLHFQPLKILLLNSTGGLVDASQDKNSSNNQVVIPQINLPSDLESTLNLSNLDDITRKRIININKMLGHLSPQSSVVITSADQVLKELFTHRGSGTLFKHIDTFIQTNNLRDIDKNRLVNLINTTFEKTLKYDFFEKLQDKIDRMFVSENYNAAAIITHEEGLIIPYLNKFVISSDIQGLGLSETLWNLLKFQYKTLIWRSSHTNKINPWYFKNCEGSWSNGQWIVFWYGISDPETSHRAIKTVLNIDISFENSPSKPAASNKLAASDISSPTPKSDPPLIISL